MLTLKRKEYLERLLNKQAAELLKRNGYALSSIARSAAEIAADPLDVADQATMESDLGLNIHMKERDGKLLVKIREALDRLEDGTYGVCEECGEEISFSRLKARPVTTMCIQCKKRQEAEEKMRGL